MKHTYSIKKNIKLNNDVKKIFLQMSKEKCTYNPQSFCYVCGMYLYNYNMKFPIASNPVIQEQYKHFFNLEICDQDKEWVPHYICSSCKSKLKSMYFCYLFIYFLLLLMNSKLLIHFYIIFRMERN